VPVPDVSLQTVADARATLRAAGFKSTVTQQETDDEALDGLVISQDPAGNAQADPKSVVSLTVGQFVPPPDVTSPAPTTPAPTTPTPTTPTPATPTPTTPTPTTPATTTPSPPP
jgi:beta-lactam-binding protein with PASTA domain